MHVSAFMEQEHIWAIGLDPEELKALKGGARSRYVIVEWSLDNLPAQTDLERHDPMLIWVSWRVWQSIFEGSPSSSQPLTQADTPQIALLLEETPQPEQWQRIMDMGFFTVLTGPLNPTTVARTLARAEEVHVLYQDILRMTREISLERELLARKTEHLSFINRFLTRASENLDPVAILTAACEDLSLLVPISLLHGAVWTTVREDSLDARLFLDQHLDEESRASWIEYLLEQTQHISGRQVAGYTIAPMPGHVVPEHSLPTSGQVLVMPLTHGQETFGCIALATDKRFHLGRDQVELLGSAIRHLGLAVKNGMLYSRIKTKADFDGLTRVYNRTFFDEQLRKEVMRHKRYEQPLSLIILDLDHFKQVNDQYGHLMGDAVLKEVGAILQDSIRGTDIAARYGGEEFALVLPQTAQDQAWTLAERIRRRIDRHSFRSGDVKLSLTASLGIATMDAREDMETSELVKQADQALYLAKAGGRNMIFVGRSATGSTLVN